MTLQSLATLMVEKQITTARQRLQSYKILKLVVEKGYNFISVDPVAAADWFEKRYNNGSTPDSTALAFIEHFKPQPFPELEDLLDEANQ